MSRLVQTTERISCDACQRGMHGADAREINTSKVDLCTSCVDKLLALPVDLAALAMDGNVGVELKRIRDGVAREKANRLLQGFSS